jgi:antitoxin component of MazEF toxin-antitoxin module
VTIPADFAKSLRVGIGDDVEFKLDENSSRMTVNFLKKPKQILLFTDKKTKK